MRLGEDALGPVCIEGEITGHQLDGVALGSQPRQVGLLEPAGRHQLRAFRDAGSHHTQHIVTSRRRELVQIVEDEDERHRTGPECSGQARRGAAQRGHAQAGDIADQVVFTGDLAVGGSQQRQQRRGVVVHPIQRHPADASVFCLGPLRQQGGLAVPGGRGDAHDATSVSAGPLDEPGPTHRPRTWLRYRQLCCQQHRLQLRGVGSGDVPDIRPQGGQSSGATPRHEPHPACP